MEENKVCSPLEAEAAKLQQEETETVPAPSESNADGEREQVAEPAPAPSEQADEADTEQLRAVAREVLELLRLEHKTERSLSGDRAAGVGTAGLTQQERNALEDWNRRWPELAMTPGQWRDRQA